MRDGRLLNRSKDFSHTGDRERLKSCGGTYKKEHLAHIGPCDRYNLDKLPWHFTPSLGKVCMLCMVIEPHEGQIILFRPVQFAQNRTRADLFRSLGPVAAITSAAIPFIEPGSSIFQSSQPRRSFYMI